MKYYYTKYSRVVFVWLITISIIIGIVFNPAFLLILLPIIAFLFLKMKVDQLSVTLLDIGFLLLLLSEILVYLNSTNIDNSLSSLTRTLAGTGLFILYKTTVKNSTLKTHILNIVTIIIYIALIISFQKFFYHHLKFVTFGFNEFNNLKGYFHPFGIINNDWVAFLLLFLPLLLLNIIRQKKIENNALKILIFFLNVFCIIVSFSRGAYLSLAVFFLIVNVICVSALGWKRVIIYNTILVVGIMLSVSISPTVLNSAFTTVSFNKTVSQKRSINSRIKRFDELSKLLKDTPILGHGQNNYTLSKYKNNTKEEGVLFTERVGMFSLLLAERGVVGFLSYLIFFSILLYLLFKNLLDIKRTNQQKLQLGIILASLMAFLIKEISFASFFIKNEAFFMVYFLVFFLIPYDNMVFKINVKRFYKNTVAIALFLVFIFVGRQEMKQYYADLYNNLSIKEYYNNNLKASLNHINEALEMAPNNSILNKEKAVILARNGFKLSIPSKGINRNVFILENLDKNITTDIIRYLKIALESNPYDDEVFHNLSWAYRALGKIDSSNLYIDKALNINPNNPIYFVSKALFNHNNPPKLLHNLSSVIRLSPDFLESEIYVRLKEAYPNTVLKARQKAKNELEIVSEDNVILKARLSRVIMEDYPEKARELFFQVTTTLPNLSRPWLYSAYIHNTLRNKDTVGHNFQAAYLLSRNDYLTNYYLYKYHKSNKALKERNYFAINTLIYYGTQKSNYYNKTKSTSYLSNILNSHIIPNQLFYLAKPKINASSLFSEISDYYKNLSETKKYKYYSKMSKRYQNHFYFNENGLR